VLKGFLVGATGHGIHHSLDVEHFTTKAHPSILERIAPLLNVLRDLGWQFLSNGVRQDALSAITIAVAVDGHVLERHQVQVNLFVVLMGLIEVNGELAELLSLFLEGRKGACKELLEVGDFILVG